MRPRAQTAIFVTACLLAGEPRVQAQSAVPEIQTGTSCQLSSTSEDKQSSDPQITIDEIGFSGVAQMAVSDQDQIVASLKQRRYTGTLDGVTDEVLERVRAAWQNHGYLKAEVGGDAKTLTSSPIGQRIALSVRVDEELRYKLGQVTFKNNKAVTNTKTLRSLFPIKDGDIFDRSKIAKGLENLHKAYDQLGYINFTSIPNTTFDEEKKFVLLDVDFDEGKQFYLSGINTLGLDGHVSQAVLNDFLLKPGQVYNPRLFEMSMKRLSVTDASVFRSYQIHPDETAGTVRITIIFEECPAQ
jgi:outer membrane protein assembly factor BamA